MMRFGFACRSVAALYSAAILAACSSLPDLGPGSAGTKYVNPVLGSDFPDPAVLRAPDGWIYAYATQTHTDVRVLNIQVARSRDLVTWTDLRNALPRKPGWAATKQNLWAPHVIHDPQRNAYFMYYSAEPDHARGKCLAVAVSGSPLGPFEDSGSPMICGHGNEHIDPMAFDDPQTGKRLLYWGGGGKPIRVQELAPDRTSFLPGSTARPLVFPDAQSTYASLVEGAWVSYRHGYYYLYYSGDQCCSPEPSYAVMVARAPSAFGPFESYRGPESDRIGAILARNGFWTGPGHNSVITDDAGQDWMLYHAVDPAGKRPSGRITDRVLLIDPISYRDGWPIVAGPSPGRRDAPVMRGGVPQ
jgi:arabinan endo-1,5-alpha-L-arabinosidase